MIIWGSKSREIVEREGNFVCPECNKNSSYQLKKVGQYFTLYFMPLFQTKELGKYVECQQCKSHFKETVLDYRLKQPTPETKNMNEEQRFASAAKMVQMQMEAAALLYEEQLSKMSNEQEKRYLAFELGVIEYFERELLSESKTESLSAEFLNFLIYFASHKYGNNSEAVFQLWKSLVVHGLLHAERKLGFDSVNNQTNQNGTMKVGHFPGRYLKEAVGIEL